MKHIFYLIGIAFILYEMMWLMNPKDRVEKHKEMREERKNNKGKKWDDVSDKYKSILKTRVLASLTFTLWLFVGLLTFNWVAFTIKILFNFLIVAPISKATRYSFAFTALHWFNSLIGFAFGIFVIVNSYHLKIDLYEWLISLL